MEEVKRFSILIVDDEKLNILVLMDILKPEYTIYGATSGRNAIEIAEKHLPDIILLDIIMPDMDGYDVLTMLKASEKTKNIPVVFITGLSDPADEEKGLALGVADYITKPFSNAIVKIRIRNQIKLIEQFQSNEYDIMKYKLSNDALNIALWDLDIVYEDPVNSNNVFKWSPEFRRMLGFSDENDFPNVFNSLSSRLHPEDKDKAINAFAAHISDRTGQTPFNEEYRLMLKNGEYRYFQALGTTLRDSAGVPIRTAGALRDITENKEMEREIAEAMAKNEADAHWYKSILDAIPLPVTVTDANMKWTFVNTAVEDFLGVKREDIFGQPCSKWNASICGTEDCGIACAKRGQKRTFFNWKDSSYQVDAEIIHDMEGEIAGFIEVVQDITNVQVLAKQQAESEMTSRAKSAFLANMSHEIRTPLNAIWGITEILLQNETLPENILEGLDKIYRSCDLLMGIINDILDFSKIEAGKLDIIPAAYSIASLINDSIHLNMMRISDKPIEFEVLVEETIPAQLIGDELRIKQILNNLLSNAFKYTDAGKVTLSAASEAANDGVTLIFAVRDTGHGMTSGQVARLFEEYSRFNEESNRTIEGTGLGLAITRQLLNLMNAKIFVESKVGEGSLFTVHLPQSKTGDEIIGKELANNLQQFKAHRYMNSANRAFVEREPMPYGKVLVVDDVETNLYVAEGLIRPYGLQVETVMSGFESINKIKDGNIYDIVFMDHMMPKMDGIEAAKIIRDYGYTAPIIALTANAVVGQSDIFLNSGFDDFVSKPIDIKRLNDVLNKYIRDKQPPEVIEAARKQKINNKAGCNGALKSNTLLLESFIRDGRNALKTLEELLQTEGLKTDEGVNSFTVTVHGMKSSLGNIGEAALSELAYKLEQAGKDKNISIITEAAPQFMAQLNALLERIKPEQSANGTDDDINGLIEKLLAIKEMCSDYERKGALDTLAEIKNCSKETKTVLDNIMDLIIQCSFEEAEAAAADYANLLKDKLTQG